MATHNYIVLDVQTVPKAVTGNADDTVVLHGTVDGVGVILNIPAAQLASAIDAPSFQAIVQPLMLAEHDRLTVNKTKPFVVPGATAGAPTAFSA
jgi:hypothetical protein